MIRKRRIGIGAVFVTLGIALAVAFILPAQWLVVVLALALVCSGIRFAETVVKEESVLKVIVFKSSKLLGGFLRLIFGIKKDTVTQ